MSEKQEFKDQDIEEVNSTAQDNTANGEAEDQSSNHNIVEDPLEELESEIKDLKDQNLRLYAEFENFRKRTAKEKLELFGSANKDLMSAVLPVVDDFQRALRAEDNPIENEGVKLIIQKLENILTSKGLKPMDNNIGKDFDVETMEAITRIPAPDAKMKGKIIDEVEKGYYLGSKILRYAKVVVGE